MCVTELPWPQYDFVGPLHSLLRDGRVNWVNNQICVNTTPDRPDDYELGVGSLDYQWVNGKMYPKEVKLQESDFTVVCEQFKNTVFEDAITMIKSKYDIGRVRIMKSLPHTCLSWHTDSTIRVHYPIHTNDQCRMVIEDRSYHLSQDQWWHTDTLVPHTAFNGSTRDRIHLVVCVL